MDKEKEASILKGISEDIKKYVKTLYLQMEEIQSDKKKRENYSLISLPSLSTCVSTTLSSTPLPIEDSIKTDNRMIEELNKDKVELSTEMDKIAQTFEQIKNNNERKEWKKEEYSTLLSEYGIVRKEVDEYYNEFKQECITENIFDDSEQKLQNQVKEIETIFSKNKFNSKNKEENKRI